MVWGRGIWVSGFGFRVSGFCFLADAWSEARSMMSFTIEGSGTAVHRAQSNSPPVVSVLVFRHVIRVIRV